MGKIREIYDTLEQPEAIVKLEMSYSYLYAKTEIPDSWFPDDKATLENRLQSAVAGAAKGHISVSKQQYVMTPYEQVEKEVLEEVSDTFRRAVEHAYPRKYNKSPLWGWAGNIHTRLKGDEELQDKFLVLWHEVNERLNTRGHKRNEVLADTMGLLTLMKEKYGG